MLPSAVIGWQVMSPPSKQRSWLAVIPVGILLAVASSQVVLTHAIALTSWKGGGFGMFSTVDSRGARFLRVYLVRKGDDGRNYEIPVAIPHKGERLRRLVTQARTAPGYEESLERLARGLIATEWQEYEGDAARQAWRTANIAFAAKAVDTRDDGLETKPEAPTLPDHFVVAAGELPATAGTPRVLRIGAVRVEAWRYEYDVESRRCKAKRVASYTQTRPGWK